MTDADHAPVPSGSGDLLLTDDHVGLMDRPEHEFGGSWTEIKLDAVADYLGFYTRALQAKLSPATAFET